MALSNSWGRSVSMFGLFVDAIIFDVLCPVKATVVSFFIVLCGYASAVVEI